LHRRVPIPLLYAAPGQENDMTTEPTPKTCHRFCALSPDCCAFPHCPSLVAPDVDAAARQTEQIAHYRRIANENGYCGGIVYSNDGDVEGPCASDVGHEGRHQT
jgi:hypothetical protein